MPVDTPPEPNHSWPALIFDFVKTRFWSLIGLVLALIAVGLYFEVDVSVPRYWSVFAAAFLATGVPAGFAVGTKVTSWLHNPRAIWLIDLDARDLDGAIWRLSLDEFQNLEVTDEEGTPGADYELTHLASDLYVGKSLDTENQTVIGTWRGTLDDVELARSLAAVRRCRGELQDKAQRGFAIETAAPAIVSNALRGEIDTLMDTIEAGTLPDEGDALNEAIEDRLQDLGFENHLDGIVDDLEGEEQDTELDSESDSRSDSKSGLKIDLEGLDELDKVGETDA